MLFKTSDIITEENVDLKQLYGCDGSQKVNHGSEIVLVTEIPILFYFTLKLFFTFNYS